MSAQEVESILSGMGVESDDPAVIAALQEYANRFAATLLCDCKDYANHAGHKDIDVNDAKAAIAMCDTHILGSDPREKIMVDMQQVVNSADLSKLVDDKAWLIRYPKDPTSLDPTKTLLQRTYTIVPSTEVLQHQQDHAGEHQGNSSAASFQPMAVANN
jgi:transcription initiation factor TFIID subunit 9B